MNHHHDSLVNIPIATLALLTWWFLPVIESASYLAGKVIPFATLALIILQIWLTIKKLKGGKRPE